MKIYQLNKRCGDWEYYYDAVVGYYLRKEKAEEEKIKAEMYEKELREKSEKCRTCFLLNEHPTRIDGLLNIFGSYCSEADLTLGDYGVECENYHSHWDKCTFSIKEVEVIE